MKGINYTPRQGGHLPALRERKSVCVRVGERGGRVCERMTEMERKRERERKFHEIRINIASPKEIEGERRG